VTILLHLYDEPDGAGLAGNGKRGSKDAVSKQWGHNAVTVKAELPRPSVKRVNRLGGRRFADLLVLRSESRKARGSDERQANRDGDSAVGPIVQSDITSKQTDIALGDIIVPSR